MLRKILSLPSYIKANQFAGLRFIGVTWITYEASVKSILDPILTDYHKMEVQAYLKLISIDLSESKRKMYGVCYTWYSKFQMNILEFQRI